MDAPRYPDASRDWQTAFQCGLARRAFAEYEAQLAQHLKRGRKASTFRYVPPQWHDDAVDALGRNDEAGAKGAKLHAHDLAPGAPDLG